MRELFIVLVCCVVQAFTFAHEVDLIVGGREYYGGRCYMRAFELDIDGRWYETPEIDCGKQPR